MDYIFYIAGGQLGLWVGISVITLCEILGLLSQMLHNVCNWCFKCLDPERPAHNNIHDSSQNHVKPQYMPATLIYDSRKDEMLE